jgi:hypothetical protein
MTPVQIIPDAERIIGVYLRAHPDLTAVAGARVVGRTPDDQAGAWTRLTQLDAIDVGAGHEHLIDYLLQLEVYATDAAKVWQIARATRRALKAAQGQTLDGTVISRVTFAGMLRNPDTAFEPARERIILTATVRLHP